MNLSELAMKADQLRLQAQVHNQFPVQHTLQEHEADELAANLLMPEVEFRKIWEDSQGNMYQMQNHFAASFQAIGYRADKLGLT